MRPTVAALALFCLCATALAEPIPPDKVPAFAIPRMSKPPTLDGKIEPEEWREAAAISGVVNQADNLLVPRPTIFFLAWDPEHLYLACRTWVMPGYKPRVGGREPGAANTGDDGLELHFKPMGKNVPTGRTDSSYKFFINCLGFQGETVRVAVGQMFRNWLPDFKVATRLTEPGSAPNGGRWWECEVAATPKDFELSGPHQAGDTWRLMLGFNHMPIWLQARIPAATSYFDPSGYCLGALVENTPGVQMLMDAFPGPCDGTAAATFRAFNPTANPVKLSILAHYVEQTDLLKREQTLDVPPKAAAEWKLNEKLPRDIGKDAASILYRVTDGGRELLRYFAFFKVGYDGRLVKHTPPKEAFPFSATFNPIRSSLFLSGDAYYLERPHEAAILYYRVLREGESKPIAQGTVEKPVNLYFRDLIQLPPLREGKYKVVATFTSKDAIEPKTVGPVTTTFEKLDEAKAFAEWWQKGLGDPERVIPPFEPMEKSRDRVSCWGRAYRLNALGLPASIVSQGKELLAAPARIIATVGGKEEAISLRGRPPFTETKDWRVGFKGSASGGGVEFTSKGFIEQDGLAYLELTYAPRRGPVTVDALRIEFPLAPDEAECLLCLGTGGNFSARTTMLLADAPGLKSAIGNRKSEIPVWSTLDTGRTGSAMSIGSFYPCVWLGSERRGLLWWGDSDRGWVPDNDVPAHDVVRKGGELVLRNHIIGKPFTLDAPRTIAFAYMASPFRPLAKNWRAVVHSTDGTFSGGESWGYKWRKDPRTGKPFDGWNLLTPPSADPAEWSSIWAEYRKKSDEKLRREKPFDPAQARNWMFAHTSLPLVGYGWKSPDERVTRYFAPAEWGESECYTDSNIDYYLYLADRAFREGGLRTIYWDIFFPILHHSVQNGVAYALPDGRIQPGYTGFNTRRFMMRMYALMHDHGLTPGSQVSHATNDYLLVACPWMDAILDGEYHQLTDASTMDWVDGYPIDRMRALSCVHNWGVVISWMNLIQVTDKARAARIHRGIQDYLRLYDSWRGPVDTLKQPILEWGILDAEYIPFWRNPSLTPSPSQGEGRGEGGTSGKGPTLPSPLPGREEGWVAPLDPDILVSAWRLPDRILLAVFNNNPKQAKDAVFKVWIDKLGLVPKLPWQEFIRVTDLDKGEGEPPSQFSYYGSELKVPALAPHTGRLISIRRF